VTDVGSDGVERACDRYWKDGRRYENDEPTNGNQREERHNHERILPFRGPGPAADPKGPRREGRFRLAYLFRETWVGCAVAW
jgi:hypothetical protein